MANTRKLKRGRKLRGGQMPEPADWAAGQALSQQLYQEQVAQADRAAVQAKSAIRQASGVEEATIAATIPELQTLPKFASSGAYLADEMASSAQYMASPTTRFMFGGKRLRGGKRGGASSNKAQKKSNKNKSKKNSSKKNNSKKNNSNSKNSNKPANVNKNAPAVVEPALLPISASAPVAPPANVPPANVPTASAPVGGARRTRR
jgi:hypothetical protein